MKDKQSPTKPQRASIPVLSPVLHVICMPVIVFLRRDFGYSFLRPKSIFAAITWAFILFTIYVWNERSVWSRYYLVCFFGTIATLLYGAHLLFAFLNEIVGDTKHDNYAGTPWIHSLFFKLFTSNQRIALLLIEPAIVAASGLTLSAFPGSTPLTKYLYLAAAALWIKEALNRWHEIRKVKLHHDILEDAEDQIGKASRAETRYPETPIATTRKRRVQRRRVMRPEPQSESESDAADDTPDAD